MIRPRKTDRRVLLGDERYFVRWCPGVAMYAVRPESGAWLRYVHPLTVFSTVGLTAADVVSTALRKNP